MKRLVSLEIEPQKATLKITDPDNGIVDTAEFEGPGVGNAEDAIVATIRDTFREAVGS